MLTAALCLVLSWNGLSSSPLDASQAPALDKGSLRGTVDLDESQKRLGREGKMEPLPEIVLQRELEGWQGDPRSAGGTPSAIRRTRADELGTFRIADLSPGLYRLEARAGELTIEHRGLRIEAGRETVLPTRLIFEPKAQLAVRLTPIVDPWQRPWRARLLEPRVDSRELHYLAEGATDDSGLAILRDLTPREALLRIEDADGRTWLEQAVEVYPERPELFLSVDVVAVEGRLLFGAEPLAAELSFGTTQSGADLRMKSGENGRFSGYLPNEGRWAVELLLPGEPFDAQRLRDVEVRRRPGKSRAELEIRVPATRIEGKVLWRGEPVAGAGVTVVRERSAAQRQAGEAGAIREAVLTTDAEGRFRLRGIEEGDLSLMAIRGRESSGWNRIELREGAWPAELVLELEEKETLRGLVASGPTPVSGAQIVAAAASSDPRRGSSYFEAATGSDGTFELDLPASLEVFDLLVAAPNLGIELTRVEKSERGWAPLILSLGGEGGSLRPRLAVAEGARDFSSGLIFRRNGASLRWMPVIRILTAQGRLELGAGEIVLRGMAPGPWEVCREGQPESCLSGILTAGGELTLASPPARGGGAPASSGEKR